jgi:glycosyltransferase involved in cell wall biosynthesis
LKKALIIAYIYPPIGGSGVQRTLKFARYLPQFGWQPIVVCGDDGEVFHDGYDSSLLAEIPPEAIILRTHFLSPLAFRRWIQKILGIKRRDQHTAGAKELIQGKTEGAVQKTSTMRRFLNYICSPLAPFEFPPIDAALYWAISIIPLCLRIIQKEKVDVIYSTSFPYSDHVTGYILKRLTGKPWVADFRDPWTQNPSAKNQGWRSRIDMWMEKAVLSHADRVIGVTPTEINGLRNLALQRPAHCFHLIENGYDQDDFKKDRFSSVGEQRNNRIITIAHVGMAYEGTVLPLLSAIRHLSHEDQARLKFLFIGGLPQLEMNWLAEHSLAAQVEVTARVSHREAIQAMQQADVVFLPVGEGPAWTGHYPGKLFEYLVCGTPILYIGPEGDAFKLISQTRAGYPLLSGDLDGAVRILHLIANDLAAFKSRFYFPNMEMIAHFERRNLTSQLAFHFDSLRYPWR